MKKRGEITVFLSLTLVCILSLFMGLLQSARTAGARLYLWTDGRQFSHGLCHQPV